MSSLFSSHSAKKAALTWALPFFQEKDTAGFAGTKKEAGLHLSKEVQQPISHGDFTGKSEEIFFGYDSRSGNRVLFVGLGEKKNLTVESLRRAYAALVKECQKRKLHEIALVLPSEVDKKHMSEDDLYRGISEGVLLTNYAFNTYQKEKKTLLKHVYVEDAAFLKAAKHAESIVDGVFLARDLVNANADETTPERLAEVAKGLEKQFPSLVKTTVFDKKRIEKEGMGLLAAVGRGSNIEPRFIIIHYKGNSKEKQPTVLIGKGVTYDTGGLNLKPTGSMETMKCDMAGAAAVLGTINALAEIKAKVNVVGIIPTTENSIGSGSYKPGDVYRSYSGKTVEIGNTDAEGRLILADALSYAVAELNPKCIFDLATLTGAIEIALGNEASGMFTDDDKIAKDFDQAGKVTFERVWRIPLYKEYRDLLKSHVADIKNVGGRSGGSITAALFLKEFVGDKTPWAHFDIAATAFLSDDKRYHLKHGTGIGVRLLVEYLTQGN